MEQRFRTVKLIRLTASWTPNANTVYHVNYWVQKSTDPYNAASADKTIYRPGYMAY